MQTAPFLIMVIKFITSSHSNDTVTMNKVAEGLKIEAKKILVVDDEEKIVEVIKSYLEKDGYKVITAYNGKDAMEVYSRENISLIILDLMLPDISGEEICAKIRKESRVPIIMLTAKVEEENILKGFDLGTDDYITKPFSPRQLIARVKAVLKRSEDSDVPIANMINFNNGDLIVDVSKHDIRKNGISLSLTPSEYNILLTMLKYPKKTFTREELVITALGDDYDGYDRIIDTHIKNLRQKIETNAKEPQYIITVHGIGYKFGGE